MANNIKRDEPSSDVQYELIPSSVERDGLLKGAVTLEDVIERMDDMDAYDLPYNDTELDVNNVGEALNKLKSGAGGGVGGNAYYYDQSLTASGSFNVPRYGNGVVFVNVKEIIDGSTLGDSVYQFDPLEGNTELSGNVIVHDGYLSANKTTSTTIPTGDYYIDPVNGNDSNDGTSIDTAWKSLSYALYIISKDPSAFVNKKIILLSGTHRITYTDMVNYGFSDSGSVSLIPLYSPVYFIGMGYDTLVVVDGEFGTNNTSKRTYGFVPFYTTVGDGMASSGEEIPTTFENMRIHFINMKNNSSNAYESPIFASHCMTGSTYTTKDDLNLILRNVMISNVDGRGLYYANDGSIKIKYENVFITGVEATLSNYLGNATLATSCNGTCQYSKSSQPASGFTVASFSGTSYDDYLAWEDNNHDTFLYSPIVVTYTKGEGVGIIVAGLPLSSIEQIKNIVVYLINESDLGTATDIKMSYRLRKKTNENQIVIVNDSGNIIEVSPDNGLEINDLIYNTIKYHSNLLNYASDNNYSYLDVVFHFNQLSTNKGVEVDYVEFITAGKGYMKFCNLNDTSINIEIHDSILKINHNFSSYPRNIRIEVVEF